ncbi:MAG TPA: carbohydrate-binding protein, partial [Oceanipulchritudo sp.]|nr:carbohydrate-binding protein [Oceanipulchritudo sp.]
IPGSFDPGDYDWFEGGSGQDVTYHDSSLGNNGDYRENESVDSVDDPNEGATLGWISDGEWLDYTIEVATSGKYSLSFRYASGNAAGGGPFYFELDGRRASANKTVPSSGGWGTYKTATLENVELRAGVHVLRLNFLGGEMNLGRLTFSYTSPLDYLPPEADAGTDLTVLIPATSIQLDGSASTAPSGGTLTYFWEQVAGPALAEFSDATIPAPLVDGLVTDGLYRFRLTVNDGAHEDFDEIEVLRGTLAARPPTATILSPSNGSFVIAGQPLTVNVVANDPDGEVVRVELFNGTVHLGTLTEAPFAFAWSPPEGTHNLSARVTDTDNLTATSSVVTFTANMPLPCTRASASGDFEYQFSSGGVNPTITFIPLRSGVGSPTLIFYYGTGSGPYPGYNITPNTPYKLNATEGQTIRFYFTYSAPGGERNSLAENASYTIGTCGEPIETDPVIALANWQLEHFDPTDLADSELEATLWGDFADPEEDGLLNVMEFATGSDPMVASPVPLQWRIDPVSGKWRVRFPWRFGLPVDFGGLEWSTDLVNWSTAGIDLKAVSLQDGIQLMEASIEFLDTDPSASCHLRLIIN